jgi:hypothetical protein
MMDIDRYIFQFFHCRECLEEWKASEAPGQSPATYARLSVGFTALGLQVVCARHDLNVVHIDFEGQTHPADLSKEGDFGGTYWALVEARQKDKKQ